MRRAASAAILRHHQRVFEAWRVERPNRIVDRLRTRTLADAQPLAAGRADGGQAGFAGTGVADVRFALASPALFRIIFGVKTSNGMLDVPPLDLPDVLVFLRENAIGVAMHTGTGPRAWAIRGLPVAAAAGIRPAMVTMPRQQTAIVTGGARRIGAAMVRALAADGWHVVIHCNRSTAEADALAAEVGDATVVSADLADPDAGSRIVDAAQGAPPLGLLVNSASRFVYDRIDTFEVADFDAHMAINVRAPALITRAFAAAIPVASEAALVVNLLDAKLSALNPDYLTYTLSKIAFDGLTELTARAYAPRLRCAAIAPAVTLVSGPQSRENFEAAHGMNPLRRGVAVDEIVAALRFIIATPTYNAQTLTLDGGQRLMGLRRDVAYMVEE